MIFSDPLALGSLAAERVKLLPLPPFSTNNESENSGGMDDSGHNEGANDDNSGTKSVGNGPEESPKAGGSSNAAEPKVSKVGTSRRNGSGPRSGTGSKAPNAGGKRPAPKGPTAGPSSKKTNLRGTVNDKDPQVFLEMYNVYCGKINCIFFEKKIFSFRKIL